MPINLQNFTKLYENKRFSYLESWKSGVTTASSEILVIDTCVSMWIGFPGLNLGRYLVKNCCEFCCCWKNQISIPRRTQIVNKSTTEGEWIRLFFFLRYFNLHRFFAPTFRQSRKASAYVSIVVECEPCLVVHFWVSFLHDFVCIIQFAT